MKKLIALILVIAIVFSLSGTAMAKAPTKQEMASTSMRAMKNYVKGMVGKTFTGTVELLFPIVDGKGALSPELVTSKAYFVSRVLTKGGVISSPLTSKRFLNAVKLVSAPRDGALLFSVRNGVSNIGICFNGYQYYVGKLNKVVEEKYNSKQWTHIGVMPGM